MRKAGVIPDAALAQRFGDYLLSRGVQNRVDEAKAGYSIWIEDEERLDEAQAELEEFLAGPERPKYFKASEARSIRQREEQAQEAARKRYVDVRTQWAVRRRAGGRITVALVIVCVGLYILFNLGPASRGMLQLRAALLFASGPGRLMHDLAEGQLWRLVTPVLLHGGLLHLGFNMLWLYTLGRQIEAVRRRWVYVGLLLATAVLSSLTQYLWAGPYFVGLSGVVYGLLGYVWVQGRTMRQPDLGIDRTNMMFMMGWLVVSMTGLLGPIANGAHIGGLIVGAAAGSGPLLRRKLRR